MSVCDDMSCDELIDAIDAIADGRFREWNRNREPSKRVKDYEVLIEVMNRLNIIQRMETNMLDIKIKYHVPDMPKLDFIAGKSDWIDLYAAEDVEMQAGEFRIISLGVSMKLPAGYEAHVAPRSSTFKKWGILQTNGVGVIDETYCGENDIWGVPALAMKNTTIRKGDRIAQFRIMPKMQNTNFIQVEHMEDEDRGGFGSTGSR